MKLLLVKLLFLWLNVFHLSYAYYTCGTDVNRERGQLVSPNFPSNYPKNHQCSSTISSSDANRFIGIQIIKLDVDCTSDYLLIMGQKHCGEKKDVYVYSWDPTVEIIFLSMESDTGSGFFLKWKSIPWLMKDPQRIQTNYLMTFPFLNSSFGIEFDYYLFRVGYVINGIVSLSTPDGSQYIDIIGGFGRYYRTIVRAVGNYDSYFRSSYDRWFRYVRYSTYENHDGTGRSTERFSQDFYYVKTFQGHQHGAVPGYIRFFRILPVEFDDLDPFYCMSAGCCALESPCGHLGGSCSSDDMCRGNATCRNKSCPWDASLNCCILTPIHGNWGSWSTWSHCSQTCGEGRRVRTLVCDNPAPQDGGSECQHDIDPDLRGLNETEYSICNIEPCSLVFTLGSDNLFYSPNGMLSDWHNAKKICESNAAQLAVVSSPLTQDYLAQEYGNRTYWIGGRHGINHTNWHWVNYEAFGSHSYTFWSSNEYAAADDEDVEKCLQMKSVEVGKWVAVPCNNTSDFICQKVNPLYMMCYNGTHLYQKNQPKSLYCTQACFMTQSLYCYCRENFIWNFHDTPPIKIFNKTCTDFCNNKTISNSSFCQDPASLSFYDITSWYRNSSKALNFINVPVLIRSYKKFRVDVLHPPTASFHIAFGDGSVYGHAQENNAEHIYTMAGDFQISVVFRNFDSFNFLFIKKSVHVAVPIRGAIIDCNYRYIVLDGDVFTCTGKTYLGDGLTATWKFDEVGEKFMNVADSLRPHFINFLDCFHDCKDIQQIGFLPQESARYMFPHVRLKENGLLMGFEFYARTSATFKLQIYESEQVIVKEFILTVTAGYHYHNFSFEVKKDNFIGLHVPADLFEGRPYSQAVMKGENITLNWGYRARLIVSPEAIFKTTYEVKSAGLHNVHYMLSDKYGYELMSESRQVIAYSSNINLKSELFITINTTYNISAIIVQNNGFDYVQWSAFHNKTLFIVNENEEQPFQSFKQMRVDTRHTMYSFQLKCKVFGAYTVTIELIYNNEELSKANTTLYCHPENSTVIGESINKVVQSPIILAVGETALFKLISISSPPLHQEVYWSINGTSFQDDAVGNGDLSLSFVQHGFYQGLYIVDNKTYSEFHFNVDEKIAGLSIYVVDMKQTFVNTNITLNIKYMSGSDLKFNWTLHNDLEVVSKDLHSDLLVLKSNQSGTYTITLTAYNQGFSSTVTTDLLINNFLSYFEVYPSKTDIFIGESITFLVNAMGGGYVNRKYEFIFPTSAPIRTRSLTLQHEIRRYGYITIKVRVILFDDFDTCTCFSIVPCEISLPIYIRKSGLGKADVVFISHEKKDSLEWPYRSITFGLEFLKDSAYIPKTVYQISFGDGTGTETGTIPVSAAKKDLFLPLTSYIYSNPGCFNVSINIIAEFHEFELTYDFIISNFQQLFVSLITSNGKNKDDILHVTNDDLIIVEIQNGVRSCYNYITTLTNLNETSQIFVMETKKKKTMLNSTIMSAPCFYKFEVNVTTPYTASTRIFKKMIALYKKLPELHILEETSNHTTATAYSKTLIIICEFVNCTMGVLSVDFGDNSGIEVLMNPKFQAISSDELEKMTVTTSPPHHLHVDISYLMLQHNYTNFGTYNVHAETTDSVFVTKANHKILINELRCLPPVVSISGPHDGSALTFRRTNQFSVASSVSVECELSKRVLFEWMICESSDEEMELERMSCNRNVTVKTDLTKPSILIPKGSLPAGIYLVKLTATIERANLLASDAIFIKMVDLPLRSVINGGSFRKATWAGTLTLDAQKTLSLNQPDEQLEFSWKCLVNDIEVMKYYGVMWEIEARKLWKNTDYTFILTVTSQTREASSQAEQTVVLVAEDIPIVSVECVSNCGQYVNPNKRLSLSGICQNCEELNRRPIMHWEYVSGHVINGTLTGTSQSGLVIKDGVLSAATKFSLRYTVTFASSGSSSYADYIFQTSSPPFGGQCEIAPINGTSLDTQFTVVCFNWTSPTTGAGDSGGFNYKIYARRSASNDEYELIVDGPVQLQRMLLPSGLESAHYGVDLLVKVVDFIGLYSSFGMMAYVSPAVSKLNYQNVQDKLTNMTRGKDSVLETFTGAGDTQGLLQFVGAAVDVLSSVESASVNVTEEKEEQVVQRQEIREEMVAALTKVDFQTSDTIMQTASVLSSVLSKPKEISNGTQKMASGIFSKMVDVLESSDDVQSGQDPEYVRQVVTGVVKGAGQLLQASPKVGAVTAINEEESVAREMIKVVDKVMSMVLIGTVAGEEPTRISNDNIAVQVSRSNPKDILGKLMETLNGGSVQTTQVEFGDESVIDTQLCTVIQNPYSQHPSAYGIDAPVTSLSFTSNDKRVDIAGVRNKHEPKIEMFTPQVESVNAIRITANNLVLNESIFSEILIPEGNFSLVFHLNIPSGINGHLQLAKDERPTNDDHIWSFSFSNITSKYTLFETESSMTYVLGVYVESAPVSLLNETSIFVEFFTASCLFWNEKVEKWQESGCKVGNQTTTTSIHCVCNHLTWFGSKFFVPPNKLNILAELSKLGNLDEYPAMLATICTIVLLYIVMLIWAKKKDLQYGKQGEPIFLHSTKSTSGTIYHMAVYTGHRVGSGTTSLPMMVINGKKHATNVLVLKNDSRNNVFQRGSVDSFIFSSEKDLGSLKYIEVWHNNEGADPDWYLSRVKITKLSTNEQTYFICNDWLGIDQSDGLIQRVIPHATKDELISYENVFLAKTTHNFCDGHLWYSVFARPVRSNFTCVQRMSVCLNFLLTSMLTSAMFYGVEDTRAKGNEIEVAYFTVTWSGLMIGFQSCLIAIPINLIIAYLFRQARPPAKTLKVFNRDNFSCGLEPELMSNSNDDKAFEQTKDDSFTCLNTHTPIPDEDIKGSYISNTSNKNRVTPTRECVDTLDPISSNYNPDPSSCNQSYEPTDEIKYWPGWVRYIAWCLCFTVSATCGFFTILYGMSFGRKKQEEWLISLVVSLFTDIGMIQPIKVLVIASIVTLIVRQLKDSYIVKEILDLKALNNDDICKRIELESKHRQKGEENDEAVAKNFQPLSKPYLERLRKIKIYEKAMMGLVNEILAYLFFIFLCLMIAYGHRDPDAYRVTRTLEDIFYYDKFDQIRTIPDFWSWTQNHLGPGLYGKQNGGSSYEEGISLLLGPARIRQSRNVEDDCNANINSTFCQYPLNTLKRRQLCENWTLCPNNTYPLHPDVWKHQNAKETGSFITYGYLGDYLGDGYVVVLADNPAIESFSKYLFDNMWLDDSTNAIFVEFNVYNTHVNFYSIVTFIMEIPENGGAVTHKRVITTRLDRYATLFSILLGICECLFLLFVYYQIKREWKRFRVTGCRYFKDAGNLYECLCFLFVMATVVCFFLRLAIVADVKETYLNADKSVFTSFEPASIIDSVYGNMFGTLTFFMIVKILNMLRFNPKMTRLYKTVKYSYQTILYFGISFFLVFTGFTFVGYLHLGHVHVEYSTVLNTMQSLFGLLLGKVNLKEFIGANDVFTNIFFICFCFMMTFVMLNMFISIITEAFAKMDHTPEIEYEILEFMKRRLAGFLPPRLSRMLYSPGSVRIGKTDGYKSSKLDDSLVDCYIGETDGYKSGKLDDNLGEDNNIGDASNPLADLEGAVDRISQSIEGMLDEDEYQLKVLEILLGLQQMKYRATIVSEKRREELGGCNKILS